MNDVFYFVLWIVLGSAVFVMSQTAIIFYLLKVIREQDEELEDLQPPF